MEEAISKKESKKLMLNCVLYSITTGVVVGAVIFFFRLVSDLLMSSSKNIYNLASVNTNFIPVLFLILFILSLFMYFNLKYAKESSGGGIARSIGIIRNLLIPLDSLRTILGSIVGSFISFFGGLSLGSEGPSVYIGTLIGNELNRLSKIANAFLKKAIHTAGTSGGFVAATGAPLSGILFSLEEAHDKYDVYSIASAIIGALLATLVSCFLSFIFNVDFKLLNLSEAIDLNLAQFYVPLIVGLCCGVGAIVFNFVVKNGIILFNGLKKKKYFTFILILLCFITTGVIGLLFTDLTGSGCELIFSIVERKYLWYVLVIILLTKVILITLSTSSGSTGGLFMPILVVGGIIGGVVAEILTINGLSHIYYTSIVLIAIVSFMGSSVKAPITAIAFSIEISNNVLIGFWSAIAIGLGFLVFTLLKGDSLNESILEITLQQKNKTKTDDKRQ